MPTIHLGVVELPYFDAPAIRDAPKNAKRRQPSPRSNAPHSKTTGDVAEFLEAKYHIMETFYELNQDVIEADLLSSLEGALQNIAAGMPPQSVNVSAEAASTTEQAFRDWLSNRGMDATSTPGVPTRAAMRGVSHRFSHPYARRGSRPSFIDTGLYQSSMRMWID